MVRMDDLLLLLPGRAYSHVQRESSSAHSAFVFLPEVLGVSRRGSGRLVTCARHAAYVARRYVIDARYVHAISCSLPWCAVARPSQVERIQGRPFFKKRKGGGPHRGEGYTDALPRVPRSASPLFNSGSGERTRTGEGTEGRAHRHVPSDTETEDVVREEGV